MTKTAAHVKSELNKLVNKNKVQVYGRFFKTGKGEYAEGDRFIGVTGSSQRILAKQIYKEVSLRACKQLLTSPIHEHRQTSLLILTYKYLKADHKEQKAIVDLYLEHTKYINNWDLVDCSADKILGKWLLDKNRSRLYTLAKSNNLWEKRIAIISTYAFIREGEFVDTLKIAELLLSDSHDLIHKAVGWMLREVGNRDRQVEEKFLKKYYKTMPRTMLRYAIEKFPENKRQAYLKGKI